MSQYLRSRLVMNLVFKPVTTPFVHVGMGARLEQGLLEVLKVGVVGGGTAYVIPSHSIKGVLRRISEHVAKASATSKELEHALIRAHCEVENESIRHVCSSDDDIRIIKDYVDSVLKNRAFARKFIPEDSIDEVSSRFKEGGIREVAEAEPIVTIECPICRLYGGNGLGGKVYIRDIVVKNGRVAVISRTSIERATGKVREGALFSVEALVIPKFELTIVVDDLEPKTTEAYIIAGTLEWLTCIGLGIGGMRSSGIGHYLLDPKESRGYIIDYGNISNKEFIKALANPVDYVKEHGVSVEDLIEKLRGCG